ncbi:hypothetical protein [Burkholderia contaminans]|uniref:hypothetical protein n=1 Tax=Burkholderia contaminans TaxID=488447 RepID=UPI0014547737|nr:hypothetical protein [Burkholderia contaminans]VWD18718.1 hypothetical protein BCO18442_03757 [Burkholderia contaminans]
MLPISTRPTHHELPSTSTTEWRFHQVTIVNENTACSYKIKTIGNEATERYLFPSEQALMPPAVIDATVFERSITSLNKNELASLRAWAAVDTDMEPNEYQYSDNSPTIINSKNSDINRALSDNAPLPPEISELVSAMDRALVKLPTICGDAIRVTEHSEKSPHPWGTHIHIGDVVSNFPCYMSASQSVKYAKDTLNGSLSQGDTDTVCIYKIDCSVGTTPILRGALTYANDDEVLFPRNACFRVDGISVAVPQRTSNSKKDFVPTRVSVLLTQIPSQRYAKNAFTGNPTHVDQDLGMITSNPLPYYQSLIRSSITNINYIADPDDRTFNLETALAHWNGEEILKLAQTLEESGKTPDQIFNFLAPDDDEPTSAIFSALDSVYPEAMAHFRTKLQKLGLDADQIDYAIGTRPTSNITQLTLKQATRILAEMPAIACLSPKKAADFIRSTNSNGEHIGSHISKLIENGAPHMLADIYINLLKTLYENGAIGSSEAISLLLPRKNHDNISALSHALTGSAWNSDTTTRLILLLARLSEANMADPAKIVAHLSLAQSGYSFKNTHLSLPADFYKLAKRAQIKNENHLAISILRNSNLIPKDRDLNKFRDKSDSSNIPTFDKSTESILSRALNKTIPEVVLNRKLIDRENTKLNQAKASLVDRLNQQRLLDKEVARERETQALENLEKFLTHTHTAFQASRTQKEEIYAHPHQIKRFKTNDPLPSNLSATSPHENPSTTSPTTDQVASSSLQNPEPSPTSGSRIPSTGELEQRLSRLKWGHVPTERELSERLLRLRADRVFTPHAPTELQPPLKKD